MSSARAIFAREGGMTHSSHPSSPPVSSTLDSSRTSEAVPFGLRSARARRRGGRKQWLTVRSEVLHMLPINKAASRRISRENLLEAKDMTTGQPPTSWRTRGDQRAGDKISRRVTTYTELLQGIRILAYNLTRWISVSVPPSCSAKGE